MRNRKQNRRTAAREDELIARHYQEVENIYRQMRAWRHDYHNHMQVIKAHLALGQTEALAAYCGQLEQELTTIDPLVKTGHILLDAILNSKLSLAQSRGITVNVKASAPAELAIKDVDLCVLMGNLLDNAMEACRPAQAPFIRVYMGMKGRQLYLCVTNTVFGRVKKEGGRFLSACGPAEDRALFPIGGVLKMDVSAAFLFSDLEGALYQVSTEGGEPVFVVEKAASFGSGGDTCWTITEDRALYTWGGNKYGELGSGTVEESGAPQKNLDGVAKAGMDGSGLAWALLENGGLYVWGTGYQRMLGEEASLSPQKILDDVVFYEFPLAIAGDGGLYIWGGDLTAPMAELQDGAFLPAPKRIADHVEKFYRAGPFLYVLQKDGSLHTWTNLNAYPYAQGPAPALNALESHMIQVLSGVKHVELLASGAGLPFWKTATFTPGAFPTRMIARRALEHRARQGFWRKNFPARRKPMPPAMP